MWLDGWCKDCNGPFNKCIEENECQGYKEHVNRSNETSVNDANKVQQVDEMAK